MIEKKLLDYVTEKMAPIKAYMERPEKPPTEYIILQKTGGSEANKLRTATFAIQTYSQTAFGAASLNERVIDIMEGFVETKGISAAELNSDYWYPDTTTKTYRYQAVFDVYFM